MVREVHHMGPEGQAVPVDYVSVPVGLPYSAVPSSTSPHPHTHAHPQFANYEHMAGQEPSFPPTDTGIHIVCVRCMCVCGASIFMYPQSVKQLVKSLSTLLFLIVFMFSKEKNYLIIC